jgi:hypothetical protein
MKKLVFLLSIPLIAISCSKEDGLSSQTDNSSNSYAASIAGGGQNCRVVDLKHPNGCTFDDCVDCPSWTIVVTPNEVYGLDDLAANGNSGTISSYFNGDSWHELFPELLETGWSNVLDLLQTGQCVNIEKHTLADATLYLFFNSEGDHFFGKPFTINE